MSEPTRSDLITIEYANAMEQYGESVDIKQYFKKEEILKYLNMEYEIYNKIKMSSFVWEWQKGKIF